MNDPIPASIAVSASDHLAAALKGLAGAAPFVGGALAELIGTVIPNQRLDRVARFAAALEARLDRLQAESLQGKLADEHFSDLMEDALQQATRATSEDRLERIAELVSRSLSENEITHTERKHLLRMLSELSDVEVIWLGFFQNPYLDGASTYLKRHENVLTPVRASLDSEDSELDKSTLQESYKAHLAQLGLLDRVLGLDRNKAPEIDRSTGDFKIKSYKLTRLGRLLLREIGVDTTGGE